MKTKVMVALKTGLATLCGIAITAGAAQTSDNAAHIDRMDQALDSVIAPGTTIGRVATGFKFTEGPMMEVAANIAFAEQGRIAYITASSSIYKLALQTPGTMPLYQR